ncbi:hypothetical protein M3Y94_01168200 [Aphelenchoides besseyi]|nr:hypothetical protein M3Y94_01168200 [Aphelenchoides besseyi]
MIQNAEFSRKNLFPTFLSISPPYSREAMVFVQILDKLNYRQVVVMTVENEVNGREFEVLFGQLRLAKKIHVQKHISVVLNENLQSKIEDELQDATANTVVLYARRAHAERIFNATFAFNGEGRVWIVNELASRSSNLPVGSLSVRLKQTVQNALRDSLRILREGANILATFNQSVEPPIQCDSTGITMNEWVNTAGMKFYNKLIDTVAFGDESEIRFDKKGEPLTAAYDIVNLHDLKDMIVVGLANHAGEVTLDESRIIWPGKSKIKPTEITLPKHLRVVAVADPPFVYQVPVADQRQCEEYKKIRLDDIEVKGPWYACKKRENSTYTASFCCAGLSIDLLASISRMEPQFHFDISINQSYGAVLLGPSGYYLTGMINELDTDNADLAIGALTINVDRLRYIDFSKPFLYHGIRVLEKLKPRKSPMESFLQPLQASLWISLFVAVVSCAIVIYALDRKLVVASKSYYFVTLFSSPFEKYYIDSNPLDSRHLTNHDSRLSFGESMWFCWGVLLNSGVSEKTPRSFSASTKSRTFARVLGIVFCGFSMIVISSYTANLAAFLVLFDEPLEKETNGINDPRFRNPSINFSFGTLRHSNTYQYFKRSIEYSGMFRKMEKHNFDNSRDAINSLLNDSLGAFIWDSVRLDFEASRNCKLRASGPLFGRSVYAIGLQRQSPWTSFISANILKLSESTSNGCIQLFVMISDGTLGALEQRWIQDAGIKACHYEKLKTPTRLGLSNMRDLFILVAAGVVIGAIMSVIEVMLGRRKEKAMKTDHLARSYVARWRNQSQRRAHHNQDYEVDDHDDSHLSGALQLTPTTTKREHQIKIDSPRPSSNFSSAPISSLSFKRRKQISLCELYPDPLSVFLRFYVPLFAFFLFLWPCALAPFHLTWFADFNHICPGCGHVCGRYRRGFSPKFFV